ncbi:MAG: hypothetical protein ACRC8A_20635 [Microcoleaceae cyanobacterium]
MTGSKGMKGQIVQPLGLYSEPSSELTASGLPQSFKPTNRLSGTQTACPADLDQLVQDLLPDLPSYANRARLRYPAKGLGEKPSYVISAERLELEPLPPEIESVVGDNQVIIITTWERWYEQQRVIEVKQVHWLIWQRTQEGWILVQLFSKSSPYPGYRLLPEIRDNTKGWIAAAIRQWLQDCLIESPASS